MKIISKFKDYYDYLQGLYGVDEKKILDRTKYYHGYVPSDIELIFCNSIYVRYSRESWDKSIKPYLDKKWNWSLPHGFRKWELVSDGEDFLWYKINRKEKTEAPYVLKYWDKEHPFPILKDLGFQKAMPAKEAYLAIEEFISYKEPSVPSNPTDMQRFEGKGFDKKTSFRH